MTSEENKKLSEYTARWEIRKKHILDIWGFELPDIEFPSDWEIYVGNYEMGAGTIFQYCVNERISVSILYAFNPYTMCCVPYWTLDVPRVTRQQNTFLLENTKLLVDAISAEQDYIDNHFKKQIN